MRQLWFCLVFMLLLPVVFAQGSIQPTNVQDVSPVAEFEKVVVKEHFVTKQEIKNYLDVKAVEYQTFTEEEIARSFDEVKSILDAKIRSFMLKLMLGILAIVFFSGSFWYFVKKKLDKRYRDIQDLRNVKKPVVEPFVKPEPVVVSEPVKVVAPVVPVPVPVPEPKVEAKVDLKKLLES